MKKISIFLTIMSSLFVYNATAQVANLSPQTTQKYTLADINALSLPINNLSIKENVYCSFIDTETFSGTNIKRVFVLNSAGIVLSRAINYPNNSSSSSVGPIVNKTLTTQPPYLSNDINAPIYSSNINNALFNTLSGVTASGNIRTFNYLVGSKTKNVIATSSGFYYKYGSNDMYVSGC